MASELCRVVFLVDLSEMQRSSTGIADDIAEETSPDDSSGTSSMIRR